MARGIADVWVQNVSPADRTADVAAGTLAGRLGTVRHYLRRVTDTDGGDSEGVHKLRVWCRRSDAALRLYDDFLPARRSDRLRKMLRRLRRAADTARNCDVLLERLSRAEGGRGAKRRSESLRADRAKAAKVVVEVCEKLDRGGRFERRVEKLLNRVRFRGLSEDGPAADHFGTWAKAGLRRAVEDFFAAAPADPSDRAALHKFRIRGKALRYGLEHLAGAFPDTLRTQLYPRIERLLEDLGRLNDLATAEGIFRRKIKTARRKEAAAWRWLLTTERAKLDDVHGQVRAGLTPQALREMREQFDAMLAPAP